MKTLILPLIAVGLFFQSASARMIGQFDTDKDILIAQFDCMPDHDDIHSIAALGSMLTHPDFDDVNVYPVMGAYGFQDRPFINATELFNEVFGSGLANWANAHANKGQAATQVRIRAEAVLAAGGKVFVQEAGQSDVTRAWLLKLRRRGVVTDAVIKNNVIVVQHSDWNEAHTTPSFLANVKNWATYVKIEDGNHPNSTPDYNNPGLYMLRQVVKTTNPNQLARGYWLTAMGIIVDQPTDYVNPAIDGGGVDFSDCVENWYIFGLGNSVDTAAKFFNRYCL